MSNYYNDSKVQFNSLELNESLFWNESLEFSIDVLQHIILHQSFFAICPV